jgi:hypothetical protein
MQNFAKRARLGAESDVKPLNQFRAMRAHSKSVPAVYHLALLYFLWAGGWSSSFAAPTNIFSTQFEAAQGYNPNLTLAGQNGWTKFGSGGNGLTNGFFAGQGQHAYVGHFPPAPGNSNLFVWHPINFSPVAAGLPLVTFTTLMSIVGSTNGFDFFQWHVFNNQTQPLIVIDFDTDTTNVGYFLDGTEYVDTGVKFALGATYTLTVTMNFASNRWSATLNSALLATNQPLTTTGKQLTLGDVDAVWDIYIPNAPGDNFMLFDNYSITADVLPPRPPRPSLFAPRYARSFNLTFPTQSNFVYTVEFADRPQTANWTTLTNLVGNGQIYVLRDYTATNAARYYRVRTQAGAARPTLVANGLGRRFSFSLATQAGATYSVDGSPQLQPPVWTLLRTFTGDGSVMTFVDDAATDRARFYRVRIE